MKKPLQKIAVIGTGILGTQIAMMAANAGYKVKVYDPVSGAFDATYKKIQADLQAKGVTPFIPWEKWEKCKKAVKHETDLAKVVKEAELVIEATPGLARCLACGAEGPVQACYDPCAACGGFPQQILAGRDLRLLALDVDVD